MTFSPRTRLAAIVSLVAATAVGGLVTIALTAANTPSTSVQFSTHLITDQLRGGYSVAIADVNHDGKLDIIPVAAASPELAWYENPGWDRHVMLNDKRAMLWAAPADIDGDGIPEFALLSDFGQDPKKSKGSIWLVKSQADPKEMWKSYLVDAVPTAHRVTWADLGGDGKEEIVMAPFVGLKGWEDPKYQDNVPLLYWRVPPKFGDPWKRETISDSLYGVIHHLHTIKWNPGKRDEIITAGFDGIVLFTPSGPSDNLKFSRKQLAMGDEPRDVPGAGGMTKGSNDVYLLNIKGKRFLAAQEPWHGDEMVIYANKGGQWQRNVIYKGFIQGHEMAVGDLNGDGRDDIVAVDVTNRGNPTPASVHIFYSEDDAGTQWRHELLDQDMMAGSGVKIADINGDGRPDIVAISGNQVKYYENLGVTK
ncbi:MAG: VCBS repeat-containing protein [Bryobacterales bacterium]|nr:VCBS repeat-containing protein [Bryobacterales bacterium]